ncbi:kallistatin [Microtus ochrogaster]|uniref:Kallistatin n=1 Tax=Microtus ochrogaster TaxID=79684 RepID=A0ABM0KCB4_MICOH|nr:kallistatin [Microtus ochrogaster]XP_005343566.1 kallistatin [Microtus ochrogaster]
MHRTLCLLLLAGYLLLSHGQPAQESNNTSNQTYTEFSQLNVSSSQIIAPGNADFAFRLYHLVAAQNSEKNIFFSPLSISIALAMLSTGAGVDTQTQILEGLGFNLTELSQPEIHEGFRLMQGMISCPSPEMDISVGNALILSQDLQPLPEFVSTTEASYNSKVLLGNFRDMKATIQIINNYVKEKTHGKIKDFIKDLSPNVRMVLVNYIFFRGLWKKPFPSHKVTVSNFYVDEKTIVQVPMMLQDDKEHWFMEDRRVPCTVLRMEYQGDGATAFFILPQKGKMEEVEHMLSPGMLERWNHMLQNRNFYRKLTLHFPKFSIANSYSLEEILPYLGFQDLFTQHADFSRINEKEKLQLSKVFHKATLDVNEVGTEAAAATGTSAMFFSAKHKKHVLVFNRPFFAVIYSTSTKNILFMGKVFNPTA